MDLNKDKPYIMTASVNTLASYLSKNLKIRYIYLFENNKHELIISNCGKKSIPGTGWSIYFNHLHIVENSNEDTTASQNLTIEHIDGGLFKLSPNEDFKGLEPGETVLFPIKSWQMHNKSYFLPRWYVVTSDGIAEIECVGDILHHEQKNAINPAINRFYRNKIRETKKAPIRIIPKPVKSSYDADRYVDLNDEHWKWVVCADEEFQKEAQHIANHFGLKLSILCPDKHVIKITKESLQLPYSDEAYKININPEKIEISASSDTGVFYAGQSLYSLAEGNGVNSHTLPIGSIEDHPRFAYRGLMVDVARNFQPKEEIFRLIKVLSMYKINKLHLHLTDDESWRLQIPGLPELTNVGSVRKHTNNEESEIYPALGSGPSDMTSGSGFYTVSDYKEILQMAVDHHIEIIPEIDMPGHSHAAIIAMKNRYNYLRDLNLQKAEEYLLHDTNDNRSEAISVQHYKNNGINPCMQSSMRFVEHVVGQLVQIHSTIQPLKTVHIGGDEVPEGSWQHSPECMKVISEKGEDQFPKSYHDLQELFMRKVSSIIKNKFGIQMGMWEDGAMRDWEPFNKGVLNDADVVAYSWKNTGSKALCAYKLAKAGYPVVLSHATHLYFDHPNEADVNEIGLSWATPFIDDRKVFGYKPKKQFYQEEAETGIYEDNVVGMQAQVWSELLSSPSALHSQLFPRMIAFAERAWHQASWEFDGNTGHEYHDWEEFANTVGYKELKRLKSNGINYRVPPPGVKYIPGDDKALQVNAMYPGLHYKYRQQNQTLVPNPWIPCNQHQPVSVDAVYELLATDGERESRIVCT